MIKKINGDQCHEQLVKNQTGALAFDAGKQYAPWRQAVREKLYELLGLNRIAENACPLTILTGREDTIFPLSGVEQSFAVTEQIYAAAGAADNCRLVVMPKAHHFCPDEAWAAIMEEIQKLGW